MTEQKVVSLVACPFCGGREAYFRRKATRKFACVACPDCRGRTGWYVSEAEALTCWERLSRVGRIQAVPEPVDSSL